MCISTSIEKGKKTKTSPRKRTARGRASTRSRTARSRRR